MRARLSAWRATRWALTAAAIAVGGAATLPAQAGIMSLQQFLDGGVIVDGSMTFTGLGVRGNAIIGDGNRSSFDLSIPTVDPKCLTNPADCAGPGHAGGLLFEGNGGLSITQVGAVPVTGQVAFLFRATCDGPACDIKDNHLAATFATLVGAPSNTFGEVHEFVFTDAALTQLLAEKDVKFECDSSDPPDECGGPGAYTFLREDNAHFSGQRELWILKEITLLTHQNGETSSVDLIKQNFKVPEPGTLALLGLTLAGIGVSRRRGGMAAGA